MLLPALSLHATARLVVNGAPGQSGRDCTLSGLIQAV